MMLLAEAVKELRPDCKFIIKENELIWLDDASLKPSEAEIKDKINELQLKKAKEDKINELQNAFTAEIEDLLSPLYHEMISWYIQVDEARKIKNNKAVPTPFIDNLIKARDLGETREEFADLVINNYNYYVETYSKKLGKYQKLVKLVEKANTLTDIDKILW